MAKKKSKNAQQQAAQRIQPRGRQACSKKSSARGSERGPKVSLCVQKFILAKLDPFNPKAVGACVPQASSGSSFKFRTTARATIQIPDNRGLLLVIRPDVSSQHASMQFAQSTVSSGTTSDGCEFRHMIVRAPGDVVANGSPFKDAAFNDGALQQRLVGWGLKVTPSGPPLHRQGTMYGYVPPQSIGEVDPLGGPPIGDTFADADLFSDYQSYPTTRWANVGKGETLRLMDHTATTTQQERWHTSHESKGVGGSYTGGMLKGIAVAYLPADSNDSGSYEVEMVAHWECKGRDILGLQTANEPDAGGYFSSFSKIVSIAEDLGRKLPPPATLVKGAMQAAQMYNTLNRPSQANARVHDAHIEL